MAILKKAIPGYEGFYEVHADGTIWSVAHITVAKNTHRKYHIPARQLKLNHQFRKKRGYNHKVYYETKKEVSITLHKPGHKAQTFYVHRLLAQAFIPNPLNLPEINHRDGNPENNQLSNLEWTTSKANQHHAYQHGLMNGRDIILIDGQNHRYQFQSHEQASRFLGLDIDSVLVRYPLKRMILGYVLQLSEDDPQVKYDYVNFQRGWQHATLIDAQNHVHQFRSLSAASRYLGLSDSYLSHLLKQFPLKRQFNHCRLVLSTDNQHQTYDYQNLTVAQKQSRPQRMGQVAITLTARDGQVFQFDSLRAVSHFLDCTDTYASNYLRRHPNRRNWHGYRVRLSSDDLTKQYDYTSHDVKQTVTLTSSQGQTQVFKSLADAGRAIGLTPAQMQSHWGRRKQPCFVNGYQVQCVRSKY